MKKAVIILNIIGLVAIGLNLIFGIVNLALENVAVDAALKLISTLNIDEATIEAVGDIAAFTRIAILITAIYSTASSAVALLLSIMSLGRMLNGDSSNTPYVLAIICGSISGHQEMIVAGILGLVIQHREHKHKDDEVVVEAEEVKQEVVA